MHQDRGILYLADSHTANREIRNAQTLVFDENGRYLSRAQAALWEVRQRCGWVCVAAEGAAAHAALALAAQLPVDRIALGGPWLRLGNSRELRRLKLYARRNLALVISEILLLHAPEAEIRCILKGAHAARLCVMDEDMAKLDLLTPWARLCQNNLLIPGNCV